MSDLKSVPEFDRSTVNSPDHLNALSEAVHQLQQIAVSMHKRVKKVEAELSELEVVEDDTPAKGPARGPAPKTAAK